MRFDVTGRTLLTIFFTIFVQTNLKRILLVEFVLWMEHDSLLKEKNDTKKKDWINFEDSEMWNGWRLFEKLT